MLSRIQTVNNICVNKALISLSRTVNYLRGLVAEVIEPVKVPAAEMTADGVTKVITHPPPTGARQNILGPHPELNGNTGDRGEEVQQEAGRSNEL
jgi:hypothetical protein